MSNKIISCAEAEYTSAILTDDGEIYIWGSNQVGQSGNGTNFGTVQALVVKGIPDKVIQVALGYNHVLALTKGGEIYTWGGNTGGQLGDGSTQPKYSPQPISTGGQKIIKIAAGNHYSLALTEGGKVLAWGRRFGVGTPPSKEQFYLTPHLVANIKAKVIDISAGSLHSLALTDDGKVLAWGENMSYQLGDDTRKNKALPHVIKRISEKIKSIKSGDYFSLALDEKGKVWAWGSNNVGQQGGTGGSRNFDQKVRKNTQEYMNILPHIIKKIDVPIIKIAAGSSHCLAMTKKGKVLGWGGNYWGQLLIKGKETTDTPQEIQSDDKEFLNIPFGPGGQVIGYTSLEGFIRERAVELMSL